MKKILGIVALTLIVGAPVFAQDTTTIGYTLQMGGSNSGGATAKFDTTGVVQAGETPIYVAPTDIVTWSVVVNASGSITIDGNPWYISGAANLVWDLVLKGPNGQPVGPAFGLGSPTVPGFFSTIMDGTGLYAQQPASFSWEYGTGPYGRLIDVDTANGANMLQYTFPSTYSYYNNNNGTVYTTTAQVLAGTGTLMGMGAGYTDLDSTSTGVERLGVGIVSDPGSVYCSEDIGAKAPIAEGQINLTGLPGGTYTLELIPGSGNNVAWSMNYMCFGIGTPGAFAVPVPSANLTGSTIEFVHEGAIEGTLAVTITPPGIGGQFSVDGGTTWNDAGSIQLAAGNYTVTAKPVAGYYTPDPQNVVIAAGLPTNVTLTYNQVEAPVLAGTASVKLQGGVAYAIPFIGETVVNPGGSTSVSVECRAGGVTQIVLPFDAPVTAVDGSIDAGAEVVVTGGTITTLDLSVAGQIKVNMTTTNQNGSCITVTVSNIAKVTGGMGLTASKSIVALRGDVTANGAVDIGDINAVRAASGQPLNASAVMFRRDLTANGAIDIGDINNVRALSGNGFAGTCP